MVKALPNNNYLIRKLQTNLTQILHGIRLRPFASSHKLPDISVSPKDFQQDTEVIIQHDDLFAMAWQELYQEPPTHSGNSQSPEPEVIPQAPETNDALTYPSPLNPDPMHGPESTSNYPGSPTDDPVLDTEDEPEDHTPVPKFPRKSHYNLRQNPASNWKPDFAYYNALEINSEKSLNQNEGLDDGPEIQILADLSPDGGLRSEN